MIHAAISAMKEIFISFVYNLHPGMKALGQIMLLWSEH